MQLVVLQMVQCCWYCRCTLVCNNKKISVHFELLRVCTLSYRVNANHVDKCIMISGPGQYSIVSCSSTIVLMNKNDLHIIMCKPAGIHVPSVEHLPPDYRWYLCPVKMNHGVRVLLMVLRWSTRKLYCFEPLVKLCSVLIITKWMHPKSNPYLQIE